MADRVKEVLTVLPMPGVSMTGALKKSKIIPKIVKESGDCKFFTGFFRFYGIFQRIQRIIRRLLFYTHSMRPDERQQALHSRHDIFRHLNNADRKLL